LYKFHIVLFLCLPSSAVVKSKTRKRIFEVHQTKKNYFAYAMFSGCQITLHIPVLKNPQFESHQLSYPAPVRTNKNHFVNLRKQKSQDLLTRFFFAQTSTALSRKGAWRLFRCISLIELLIGGWTIPRRSNLELSVAQNGSRGSGTTRAGSWRL